jgi:hypothetical protein
METDISPFRFKKNYWIRQAEAAPLAVFRICFGMLMCLSIIRFYLNGWIEKLYLEPEFFFSYLGFEWVKPIGAYTYLLFFMAGLAALFMAIGYRYRIASIGFFLSFTYIELMDKTTYLNHYYFVSLVAFLMIFLPANRYYALDAYLKPHIRTQRIPRWTIDAIKLMLVIVYFYAGLAKLNSDWLLQAQPLKIWLPAKYDLPLLGYWLQKEWVHYLFSWSGAIYDLSIPFLLLMPRTRPFAFIMVVVFHVLTRILFPIGMFPFIMIFSTLIFFSANWHHRLLQTLSKVLGVQKSFFDNGASFILRSVLVSRLMAAGVVLFFAVQLLLPFRYTLYPGELFWTEEGYRFSWRVMLMEKRGYANFKIVDRQTGQRFYVNNDDFLTSFQEKQMATQPDFILEYAHFLESYYKKQGIEAPEVYVESFVSLNGRGSHPYIDPDVDLTKVQFSLRHKSWILPFDDEIKGI